MNVRYLQLCTASGGRGNHPVLTPPARASCENRPSSIQATDDRSCVTPVWRPTMAARSRATWRLLVTTPLAFSAGVEAVSITRHGWAVDESGRAKAATEQRP
jgi:hypothetical protein